MDDLIADFVADTRDAFDRLQPDLLHWARDPTDRAALDAVFRFVHTVRGNAGFLSFERFERLSVPAERALAELRGGQRSDAARVVPAIIDVVERMGAIAAAIEGGTGLSAQDEPIMVERLGVGSIPARTPNAAARPTTKTQSRTVRMPAEQFDHLATCVESVAAAHRHVLDLLLDQSLAADVRLALMDISASVDELSRAVTLSRMLPVGRLFAGLDRIVSQTAESLGKSARFEAAGGDILVDRELVDALRDAVIHLVRNALDHGIEPTDQRVTAGKSAQGLVRATAEIVAGQLCLRLTDDGAGIDIDAVAQKAKAAGIDTPDYQGDLTDAQLTQILQIAGFTTSTKSKALSGHGVGLDVVHMTAQRLGGALSLKNTPGWGSAFLITVPLQSAIARAG